MNGAFQMTGKLLIMRDSGQEDFANDFLNEDDERMTVVARF